MDDIIVPFEKPAILQQFAAYIKMQHFTLGFSVEAESSGALHFLNINVYRENVKFTYLLEENVLVKA